MNTKVKAGIAAVIVAALIALIVLDQKTTPADGTPKAPPDVAPPAASRAGDPGRGNEADEFTIFKRAPEAVRNESRQAPPPAPLRVEKVEQLPSTKDLAPKPPAPPEEYTIQEGNTYTDIAKKFYGDGNLAHVIAAANPGMREYALRVGKKIVIPPKPEKKAPEAPPEPSPMVAADPKVYVVQPGDTLTGISKKLYNTIRHSERIFEANRDKLDSAHDLRVGMKLALPDGVSRLEGAVPAVASPIAGANFTPGVAEPPAAPGKLHVVQKDDSLWKIAEKYCGDRGIEEMIQTLLKANPKLKDRADLIREGWKLIIPE